MSIRARQKGTNRGLLAFLTHGNCRVLGSKDASGKLVARAMARLLIDSLTGKPVVYIDTPYGDLNDPSSGLAKSAQLDIYDQAAELGRLLNVSIVYSSSLPKEQYLMSSFECYVFDNFQNDLVNLSDYSNLATHLWVDGLKSDDSGTFLPEYLPGLIKINKTSGANNRAITVGYRPKRLF
jgi:hypothetical protein